MKTDLEFKPDFFIVGAPKCGTTFLHNYLNLHPNLFLAQKELYYFGKDLTFKHGNMSLDYYLQFFREAKNHQLKGDNSVWYLLSKKAAQEIYNFNNRAKIIICLRNPTDLIYSLHSQQLFNGNEDCESFEKALELQELRKGGQHIPSSIGCPFEALQYQKVGLLCQQVKRYFEIFAANQIHVVLFKDIQNNPKKVIHDICDFLKIDQIEINTFQNVNHNKVSRSKVLLKMLRYRADWFVNMVKFFIPSKKLRIKLNDFLWKRNAAYKQRQEMNTETRRMLDEYFKEDVKNLEELINLKL